MSTPLRVIQPIPVSLFTPETAGVGDAVLVSSSVTETDYPEWVSTTTYSAGARVIVKNGVHRIYQSAVNSNLNFNPTTSPTQWVEVGATNKFALLDGSSSTVTSFTETCHYIFKPNTSISSLAFINLTNVGSIRVRMTDPVHGVVYDQTYSLLASISSPSWYAWFFSFRDLKNTLTVFDLPPYPAAELRIDINAVTDATGSIGAFVFGRTQPIGIGVQQGARLSMQDYSRKERNEWGDTVLVQRAFAKRLNVDTYLENRQLDSVYNLLTSLRATPVVWVAADGYSSLVVYGFFSNFDINIAYPLHSDCSIEIEGLT